MIAYGFISLFDIRLSLLQSDLTTSEVEGLLWVLVLLAAGAALTFLAVIAFLLGLLE
jgi:hypothetical protein